MAGTIHLAWAPEHVGAAMQRIGKGDCIAALSQPALGAALRYQAPLAADALTLIDLAVPAEEVDARAVAMREAILERLIAPRLREAQQESLLAAEALDRWHLAVWCREVAHLTTLLARILPAEASIRLPDHDNGGARGLKARARLYLDAALALLGHRNMALAGGEAMPQPPADAGFFSSTEPCVVMTSFGLRDPKATLARIRARHAGPIVILAEQEFAHLPSLESQWTALCHRFGALHLVRLGREFVWPAGAKDRPPLETAVRDILWPARRTVAAGVAGNLANVEIVSVHASDHVSDSAWALAMLAAERNAPLELEAHGGMPLKPEFWLPEALPARGNITLWTEAVADHYRERLSVAGTPRWSLAAASPTALEKAQLSKPHIAMRHATAMFSRLRIGILVTTGQLAFAPDIPLGSIMASLRRLVEGALAAGGKVAFRLRQFEDDERVFRHCLGLARGDDRISFHRAGERSLRRFVNLTDLCIEFGSPTSAALTAIAYGVPVVRLVPLGSPDFSRESGRGRIPHLSHDDPFAHLMRLAGPSRRRRALARSQAAGNYAPKEKKQADAQKKVEPSPKQVENRDDLAIDDACR